MVMLLDESEVDQAGAELDAAEDAVGPATIRPMNGGQRVAVGRAVARRAWMWNGSPSTLPLTWNPAGTMHDNARRYLLKRFCLCCHAAGFRGTQCPKCVKEHCTRCGGSTDHKTVNELGNGQTVKGWLIPNFYLREADVPFPSKNYGDIDCFLPECLRRGKGRGFLTEEAMRFHARLKHRGEYTSHQEAQAAARTDSVSRLQAQVDALLLERLSPVRSEPPVRSESERQIANDRMAKARAARRKKVVTKTPATA